MRPQLVTEDCFAALVRLFMSPANPKWSNDYEQATKDSWSRALMFASHPDRLGSLSLQEIRPALVQAFFDGFADRPGKQHVTMRALRQLEKWAIVRDLLPRPITLGVEIADRDGGHIPWTDEHVAHAEKHCRADLARVITLAAHTGQRGSDLIRMGWGDVETYNGLDGINVTQKKTGRVVWVPILSTLAHAMQTWERSPGPFLRRLDGLPWRRIDLTNLWAHHRNERPELEELKRAGLVLHGLRGHACVRLRRAGATALQIADMVGMSVPMVEKYCRLSVQRENASAAVFQLEKVVAERNRSGRAPSKAGKWGR